MTITSDAMKLNTEAATSAAFMEAGRIANNQLAKLAAKQLPIVVRGYAETALGKLIIANIAAVAIERFKPDNRQAATLSKAMMVQAYQELIATVDIEGLIDEMLSDSKMKRALSKLDVPAAPEFGSGG